MKAKRPPPLDIETASAPWKRVSGLARRLNAAAELALASLPEALLPAAQGAQMTLLLTTDKAVQTLNRDFRGKDKPTNVLTFPQFERRDLVRMGTVADGARLCLYVGDIAMAYGVVAREAKAEGKTILDHATHLVIHGVLHCFGYDHDTAAKATRMEKLEKEIMASLGLADPYSSFDSKKTVSSPRRRGSRGPGGKFGFL